MSIEPHASPLRYSGATSTSPDPANLADLLERILDKGIVIAGDISISLVDIELLTIRLRLLIASVDKAQEMGINWWRSDPWLSSQSGEADHSDDGSGRDRIGSGRAHRSLRKTPDTQAIEERLERIEKALEGLQRTGRRAANQKAGSG